RGSDRGAVRGLHGHAGRVPAVLSHRGPHGHRGIALRSADLTSNLDQEKTMKTQAAVATGAGRPLEIHEVELSGPGPSEVLVEVKATGVCHTDAYTLSGKDSEGLFPSILGHEGAGIVREVGRDVTTVKPGDHVIPLYTPECRHCKTCLSDRKSTRLNSSHVKISYAVFCLK